MIKSVGHYLLLFCFCAVAAFGKRTPPPSVRPIDYDGVRYVAVLWGVDFGEQQNGGFVEARDSRDGHLVWRARVYVTKYDDKIERDVQDVFITSMVIENGHLVVVNENHEKFIVNLRTHVSRKA